jgi:hypothetical protein
MAFPKAGLQDLKAIGSGNETHLQNQPDGGFWLGIEPRWTHGGKDGVGTAYAPSSRVWFTFWNGIITEV